MKKKGSTSDYISERNAELRAAFFSQNHYSTSEAVMNKTVKTPASRFWVDPERARDVISRLEKDPDTLKGMQPERRRMYAELLRRYRDIQCQFPGQSKIESVSMAIYSGAPEFYLSTHGARKILYGGRSS